MTLAGYMPNLLACADCGKYEGGEFYLDPQEGTLLGAPKQKLKRMWEPDFIIKSMPLIPSTLAIS